MCLPDPASEAGHVDWRALLARTLPQVDVFAPSLAELQLMLGRDPSTPLAELGNELLALGAAVVAIKLGERGLYLHASEDVAALCGRLGLDDAVWRGAELLAPSFRPARIAGTTGSGDAAIAGLLAALLRGDGPAEAATAATAAGACCVESATGASGIPPWPEIAARVAAGWARLA